MRTLISLSGQLQSNNQNNAGKTMEIKCTVVGCSLYVRLYQLLVSTKKIPEAMVLPPAQVGCVFRGQDAYPKS